MSVVIQKLEAQYQAPSHQPTSDLATAESAPIQQQEETQQMTQAQPTAQPSTSTLATSNPSSQSLTPQVNLGITQYEIQQAVEQQFGKENVETKTAILNYVAQDTFATAHFENQLAQMRASFGI